MRFGSLCIICPWFSFFSICVVAADIQPPFPNTPADVQKEAAQPAAAQKSDHQSNSNEEDGDENHNITEDQNDGDNGRVESEESEESAAARALRQLIGQRPLTEIDNLALTFLNSGDTGLMSENFVTQLKNLYPDVEILKSKARADSISNKNTVKSQQLSAENHSLARLIYHYSLEKFSKEKLFSRYALSQKVLDIFKGFLTFPQNNLIKKLRRYYSFPNKKIDKSRFYLQLLAYREEIKDQKSRVYIHSLINSCNQKYGTSFSKINVKFIKEDAPENNENVISSFVENPSEFFEERCDCNKISILWHHLKPNDLPEKDLEGYIRTTGQKKVAGSKEQIFIQSELENIANPGPQDFKRLTVAIHEKFNINISAPEVRAIHKRFNNPQKKKKATTRTIAPTTVRNFVHEKLEEIESPCANDFKRLSSKVLEECDFVYPAKNIRSFYETRKKRTRAKMGKTPVPKKRKTNT